MNASLNSPLGCRVKEMGLLYEYRLQTFLSWVKPPVCVDTAHERRIAGVQVDVRF